MDSKELMISDWVNFPIDITGGETEHDSQTTEYQPMQIVSISAWANNDGEAESREGVICDIEQLTPIPLTTEILEKNGFNLSRDKSGIGILDTYWLGEGIGFRLHNFETDYYQFGLAKIKYVHQLQHALRLCEISKNIEI